MALKRQQNVIAAFSMASMTDVIFLLLIFFMVTSTFVFPTALEVNLPESSQQTALKPVIRVFIDSDEQIYASNTDAEPAPMESLDGLLMFLQQAVAAAPESDFIAVYADASASYGRIVEVLDLGARSNLKMVLATKPAPASLTPATGAELMAEPPVAE